MSDQFLKLLIRFLIYFPVLILGVAVWFDLNRKYLHEPVRTLLVSPIILIFWFLGLMFALDRRWSLIIASIILRVIGVIIGLISLVAMIFGPMVECRNGLECYLQYLQISAVPWIITFTIIGGGIVLISWVLANKATERAESKKLIAG